jgi:poly(3-hydroxybutyrate) depolymerase
MKVSRWNDLAEEHGFIVVYPAGCGFPLRWRASDQTGAKKEMRKDITFISDLIDKLQSEFMIDTRWKGRVPDRSASGGRGGLPDAIF